MWRLDKRYKYNFSRINVSALSDIGMGIISKAGGYNVKGQEDLLILNDILGSNRKKLKIYLEILGKLV
jgi:hypothetical protein